MVFLQEVLALAIFMYPSPNREIFKQFLYNDVKIVWNTLLGTLKVLSCQNVLRENTNGMF